MTNIFKRLADPQLVADFQQICGVFPRPTETSIKRNQNGTSSSTQTQLKNVDSASSFDNLDENRCAGDSLCINENGSTSSKNLHLRTKSEIAMDTLFAVPKTLSGSDSDSSSDDEQQKHYVITNKLLYYIAVFGASLGNEAFYIIFFPAWFWNIDGYVGRRVCMFWALYMFFGQAAKDMIKYPRPFSPPVVQLEGRYAEEYGFPSTHAMVAAGVPFCILYFTIERYIFPWWFGVIVCLVWTSVVCFSRVYLGMHSFLDVISGLVFVSVLMATFFPFVNDIDYFMLHSPTAPFIAIIAPVVLGLIYPKLERWSTARGDTTICTSVWSGVALGHWFCFQYGFMQKAHTEPPYDIIYPSWSMLAQLLSRLVIGVVILIATRALFKPVSKNVACWFFKKDKNDPKVLEHLCIELPYKFCTYTTMAFATVFLAPQVFKYLGIERATFFTEI